MPGYNRETELYLWPRVGTDHLYWMSGRVGLSENFDLVGRWSGFFGVNLSEKMIKIADKIRKSYFFGLSFMWSSLCENFSCSDDSLLFFLI